MTVPDSLTSTTRDGETITLNHTQLLRAETIIQTAVAVGGLGTKGATIALMTSLVESTLRLLTNVTAWPESAGYPNDGDGNDHDSLGLFQQRPTAGWGTVAEIMDPVYSAKAFYGGPSGPNYPSPAGVLDIAGWETMDNGEVCQAVQVSAFPDRYQNYEPVAIDILNAIGMEGGGGTGKKMLSISAQGKLLFLHWSDGKTQIVYPTSLANHWITGATTGLVWISSQGKALQLHWSTGENQPGYPTDLANYWIPGPTPNSGPGPGTGLFMWPFDPNTQTGDEYGPREGGVGSFHEGLDFPVGCDTPIPCIGDGVGSENYYHANFGNLLIVDHGVLNRGTYNGKQVRSLYAHQSHPSPIAVGQSVTKGEIVGNVGDTGASFGCHLHMEIHITNPGDPIVWNTNNDGGYRTAVNPRTFLDEYSV